MFLSYLPANVQSLTQAVFNSFSFLWRVRSVTLKAKKLRLRFKTKNGKYLCLFRYLCSIFMSFLIEQNVYPTLARLLL